MRKVKVLIAATVMAFSSMIAFAGPAAAVVCIDQGGPPTWCCEDPVIFGKEINVIDC